MSELEPLETRECNIKNSRGSGSKYWRFTLNNWTEDELATLIRVFETKKAKYIMGKELAPSTGTPHLQGYVEFKSKVRPIEAVGVKRVIWFLRDASSEANVKYCSKDGDYITNMKVKRPIINRYTTLTPYKWQIEAENRIKDWCEDDRWIYWYWEPNGKTGKTTLARHLILTYPDEILYVSGKAADIKYAVTDWINKGKELRACIFYYTKQIEEYVSYQAIEEVKDASFFSGKFESSQCIYNPPHVMVFCNFAPKLDAMGVERFKVIKIDLSS